MGLHKGVIGGTIFQDKKDMALKSQSKDTWVPGDRTQHSALVGSRKPKPFLMPPSSRPAELGCRSVGLISGAHRLRRQAVALRAWLHLSAPERTRGRPPAHSPECSFPPGRWEKLGRACRASGARRPAPEDSRSTARRPGRWRPAAACWAPHPCTARSPAPRAP